ncbi:energy transducer TonB [Nibricoccus sp. IMCC34717]|uniref:energy transducer TonB n=1 Tax=Nibricoccus sp. IMCC34717 TaxID=3034021 RepID=UPI0038510AA1
MSHTTTLPTPSPTSSHRLPTGKRRFGPAIATAAIVHALVLFAVPHKEPPPFVATLTDKLPPRQEPIVEPVKPSEESSDELFDTRTPASFGVTEITTLITSLGDGPVTIPLPTNTRIIVAGPETIGPLGDPNAREFGPPAKPGPVEARLLDRAPEAVSQIPPVFPDALKREYSAGTVRASFVIEKDGTVSRIRILDASHPGFAAAAEKAVARWKFRPGWKNNKPVASRMEQVFEFAVK